MKPFGSSGCAAVLFLSSWVAACAQTYIVPDASVLNLDEVGIYSVGYAYRNGPEQAFPAGWTGFFEERTGVACEAFGPQQGRQAFLLHCPWRGGTGITFQDFSFKLPAKAGRILLRGATAMRSASVTNSDGATFRIYSNGWKLMEYHQTDDVWRPFEYDLSGARGSNLTVRFEVDPGPRNNAAFDYSLWGDRQLVLEGFAPAAISHPAPPPLAISNLWSGQTRIAPNSAKIANPAAGDESLPPPAVAPSCGFAGTSTCGLSNEVAYFRYRGPDGSLEYEWSPPLSDRDGLFGSISLKARMAGDKPVIVPLATIASLVWDQTATPVASGWTKKGAGPSLWRTFSLGSNTATVRITGELLGKTLALTITCDQPDVSELDAGMWGPVVRRRQVSAPYYSGKIDYLAQEGLFASALLDWTASAATMHEGCRARYGALTDGTRLPLRERVLFTAAWHVDEVLPNPPCPASPWRDFLANKIILDIWGGHFTNIAAHLQLLADYGITNCVALIHDWQRSGYDNALPMHYPANAAYGGDAGMSHLVAMGKRLGIRCALHENYADYYPNYDAYNTNDIALDSAGRLQQAWYNPGTHIQSFAIQPNAIMPLARSQSPEIHRRYATEANYLDVHSAVPPWFHVDHRAGEAGAGRFSRVWDTHRELWAFERATHAGPVFGEGNNHWYWSGCLDGVEAQFGSGWPGNGGFTAPLSVDFDLLKIHPLQFNHGMGYYSRWWPSESYQANWGGGVVPMSVLDRYRLQEVAFGHAGFLDGSVYSLLPLAWLEHHLLSPVMARYATARPVEILYQLEGQWVDASAVARLGAFSQETRVRIRYENGLCVTANGGTNAWKAGSRLLPEWGWVAEAPGFVAGTTVRDGVITDSVDSGDQLFVNARAAQDWNLDKPRPARPEVASFRQTRPRTFQTTYRWNVREPLRADYFPFVHFCSNGDILAQQDHPLSQPTAQWQSGQTISDGPWTITLPQGLKDGHYEWLIGLYDPKNGGERVSLQGMDDGASRIRLGILRVSNDGAELSFAAETNRPVPEPGEWRRQHLNLAGKVIDFGDVRTDGSVWLNREQGFWRLQVWPRNRPFALELSARRFGKPAEVVCDGGSSPQSLPVQNGLHWRLPLNGAREYRWPVSAR
jgi:hypothetical protein